jgi:DNA-binding LacI/PurR family transcriptional regulator
MIDTLGAHLYGLGHRNIACLNTQPHDRTIAQRLHYWSAWKYDHEVTGSIIDRPTAPHGDAIERAYEVIRGILTGPGLETTALICTTDGVALGASRALHEKGLKIGSDISLCALDGARASRYATPSRTALQYYDRTPVITDCLQWMTATDTPWQGSYVLEPNDMKLFAGESTGPAPDRS